MRQRPPAHAGLRHVALFVKDLEACERFYVDLLGLHVEWRPDGDNVYLSSGHDNLALHRAPSPPTGGQILDHIGFLLRCIDDVDPWHAFLRDNGAPIVAVPRTHRDGARSFYCLDPAGNRVQIIFHPPLTGVLRPVR
jgi:catechol 2,3-dioxygenase-like lactoylglutathione lyase family enzyme